MDQQDGHTVQPSLEVDVTLQERMRFEAVDASGWRVTLDASARHGGDDAGFGPMEMLLVGLGGCAAMDVLSILRKKRQNITSYRVEVSGVQAEEHPRVFTDIVMRHIFGGTGVSEEAVRRAIELSETKYCGAYAMLKETAQISSSYEILPVVPAD